LGVVGLTSMYGGFISLFIYISHHAFPGRLSSMLQAAFV